MKTSGTFSDAGWSPVYWYMDNDINDGYPYLSWQNPGGTPISIDSTAKPLYGNGSLENPYQIATLSNLRWIATDYSNFNKHFIQTADINAASTKIWNAGIGWIPIGNGYYNFSGTYNGKGYKIDSLYCDFTNSGYFGGLFGITKNASLDSINLINIDITRGAGLVGESNYTNINDCHVSGNIFGTGGLIGDNNYSVISKCSFSGELTSSLSSPGIGGLIGTNNYSTVTLCYSNANIKGTSRLGGLIGRNWGFCIINNCYATGNIINDSNYTYLGGLIAIITGDTKYSIVQNCYSSCSVPAGTYSGGLIGFDRGGVIINSFWDTDVSGLDSSFGGKGFSTSLMKNPSTFAHFAWDQSIWYMDYNKNDGYPYLYWQNPSGTPLPDGIIEKPANGIGSVESPYEISTFKNLYWITSDINNFNKYYIQTENIDAAQTSELIEEGGWMPIGNEITPFTGSYNGKGHTIDNLFIARSDGNWQGFFGYAESANIDSIGIANSNIVASDYVGALMGENNSSLVNCCFSTGTISGQEYVGGLIGYNSFSTVKNTYSLNNVSGSDMVGGLVGRNYSATIVKSYSAGKITGLTNTGGLVGKKSSSTVDDCFWDIDSSGMKTSAAGLGKTSSEMKTNTTFLDAGWDDSTWFIDADFNNGYPYLAWQNPKGSPLPVDELEQQVISYSLSQNYPNPFNPTTNIKYSIPETEDVLLKVYNILGQEVKTLVKETQNTGIYNVKFDASGLSSGVYFYRLQVGKFISVKKLVILK